MSHAITQIEQHRLAWMNSHVTESPYPTPESVQGLETYLQATEVLSALSPINIPELKLYEVDCHPLMIRYARLLSEKWPEAERAVLIEYLTQLDKDDEGHAKLYLGYKSGVPVACAMRFSHEDSFVIADMFAADLTHAQGLLHAILEQHSDMLWVQPTAIQ